MSGCLEALNERLKWEALTNQNLRDAVGASLVILAVALLALTGYGCYQAFLLQAPYGIVMSFLTIFVAPGLILGPGALGLRLLFDRHHKPSFTDLSEAL